MNFDGLLRHSESGGDGFVGVSRNGLEGDVELPGRERVDAFACVRAFLGTASRIEIPGEKLPRGASKFFGIDGLREKVRGAVLTAKSAISMSPCPERKTTGWSNPSEGMRAWHSRPDMPAMRMSITTQPGTAGSSRRKNSSALS